MEDDLGKLQREIWIAVQKAASDGDGSALSVLGPITGDMKRKYHEWAAQFQQLSTAKNQGMSQNGVPQGGLVGDDFTGKAIRGFEFGGDKVAVGTYKEMLIELARRLLRAKPGEFNAAVQRVRGRRQYFSDRKEDLTVPGQIEPGRYVETNFPANQAIKVCRDLVQAFGYPAASLRLDVVPFRTRAVKRTSKRSEDQGPIRKRGNAGAPRTTKRNAVPKGWEAPYEQEELVDK
jgi:hypothetical protein